VGSWGPHIAPYSSSLFAMEDPVVTERNCTLHMSGTRGCAFELFSTDNSHSHRAGSKEHLACHLAYYMFRGYDGPLLIMGVDASLLDGMSVSR